jgi:hypothetical protein
LSIYTFKKDRKTSVNPFSLNPETMLRMLILLKFPEFLRLKLSTKNEGLHRLVCPRQRLGLLRHHGRRRRPLPQGRPQVDPQPPDPALVERCTPQGQADRSHHRNRQAASG